MIGYDSGYERAVYKICRLNKKRGGTTIQNISCPNQSNLSL